MTRVLVGGVRTAMSGLIAIPLSVYWIRNIFRRLPCEHEGLETWEGVVQVDSRRCTGAGGVLCDGSSSPSGLAETCTVGALAARSCYRAKCVLARAARAAGAVFALSIPPDRGPIDLA